MGVHVVFVEKRKTGVVVDLIGVEQEIELIFGRSQAFGVGAVPQGILNHGHILAAIEQGDGFRLVLGGQFGGEAEIGASSRAFLGRNQQHAVGTFGTVYGRGGSILEHFNGLNIRGGNVQQGAKIFFVGGGKIEIILDVRRIGNAIDDNEGLGRGTQGVGSANTNGTPGTGITAQYNVNPA